MLSEREMEIIQGTISAIVYQNYENGYSVLRMNVPGSQGVTVVGTIPLPCIGERLMVTGRWSSHPSYGKQFEAEFLERLLPETAADILGYLSSRIIKGIGPKLAGRIVSRFGDETLHIIEREPMRLAEVTGISPAKATAIGEAFRMQVGMRHIMEFFSIHQLPTDLAVKCYRLYGDAVIDLLYDDPYLLTDEELDAPFGAVDRFAVELGIDGDDPKRLSAGLIFELRYNLNAGHCFLPREKLIPATGQLLSVREEAVAEILDRLLTRGQLIADRLAGIDVIYLPDLYEAETYCAARLVRAASAKFKPQKKAEQILKKISQNSTIQYSAQQEQAILAAAESGLLIITGGPGTGKTTILKGILSLYEEMGLQCALAAPTGRAAKRLGEITGKDVSTIHRLLDAGIDHTSGKLYFAHNESNQLKADAIIVDEMSMVDIRLLYALLMALPEYCRIILVGDPDQLPPVGPGFPLKDMLRNGILPVTQLTEIFRQAQESLIVLNSHRVNNGQLPELRDVKHDFFFLPARTEEEAAQTIVGLCAQRLPDNMGISPDQIQVLSPTKKGYAGTANLNKLLQASLNPAAPQKKEHRYGESVFRVGDRIMQIRNNYDIMWRKSDGSAVGSGIFNGDIGIIFDIDKESEQITVLFDDKIVDYDFSQLNELEPAFAMTVHKSQGSEYRCVVLSAWNSSEYLLTRSILYTAITRAKELMIIVGRQETIATMTNNAKVSRRYSGLKRRIKGEDI